jgi:two-component system chemotaxis response regulator CheB
MSAETGQLRIAVVDDSAVTRMLVAEALRDATAVSVVASLSDGEEAVAFLEREPVDVVVLDVEMPGMGGIEALRQIKKAWPTTSVVMLSGLSRRKAALTLEALATGASDFVTKPSRSANWEDARRQLQEALLPRLSALESKTELGPTAPLAIRGKKRSRRGPSRSGAAAVGIAVSTGGPAALEVVAAGLPSWLSVPILVVQHIPEAFVVPLAERLARSCLLPVRVATDGEAVSGGGIWLAQPGRHLRVARLGDQVVAIMDDSEPRNHCRPSGDVLFESLASELGASSYGVVLTGMGRDGVSGARAIVAAGGEVVIQDRETSVVWGMPGAVAAEGLASEVLPISQVPAAIARWSLEAVPASNRAALEGRR